MTDSAAITTDMFDVVQKVVFKDMFHNTFCRFIDSPAYAKMHEDIKNAYNKVGGVLEIAQTDNYLALVVIACVAEHQQSLHRCRTPPCAPLVHRLSSKTAVPRI